MTPQKALDQEGFLIFSAAWPRSNGAVVVNTDPFSAVEVGTKLVVIGEVTEAEARAWGRRVNFTFIPGAHYYKVIAE